jgi:hypothetical protein
MPDALDRIKNRNRPKVAPRDATLTSTGQDIQIPRHTDIQTPISSESEFQPENDGTTNFNTNANDTNSVIQNVPPPARHSTADISESRHIDMQTSTHQEPELQTKRSTFRMEANLIDRLHTFCRRQNISREVLIEAMFEYMEAHPDAMASVLDEATAKNDYRQQIANRKRAEAMMQKFGAGH